MSVVEAVLHRQELRQERHAWYTGTVTLAAHWPPNMPLLSRAGHPGSPGKTAMRLRREDRMTRGCITQRLQRGTS